MTGFDVSCVKPLDSVSGVSLKDILFFCTKIVTCLIAIFLEEMEEHFQVYSYSKTNEMHYFLKFIFGIELYMLLTVSLSIIRSLALHTQQLL